MSVLQAAAQTVADHAHIWAAPEPTPAPTGDIDTGGITGWVATHIIPVALVILGTLTIFRGARGNMSQTMNTTAVVLIGVIMFGAAGSLYLFGNNVADIIFK